VPLTALYEALEQVKDGRKKRGCRYSLVLILTLLLLARLAGETELRGAAHWIKLHKRWIIEHLQLKRASVPCLGTFLYALSRVDAQDLLTVVAGCLTRWEAAERCENEPSRLAGQDGQQQKQQVAVDGKTMRGTLGHEAASQPSVHVLSVYEVRTGLVLAQRCVAEKENEISAVKDLLTPVYVKDRVWTADAMHTQKSTCQDIDQLGGNYLFFFKDHHPTAHEDLALFFQDPDADQSSWGSFSQTEKSHGRLATAPNAFAVRCSFPRPAARRATTRSLPKAKAVSKTPIGTPEDACASCWIGRAPSTTPSMTSAPVPSASTVNPKPWASSGPWCATCARCALSTR